VPAAGRPRLPPQYGVPAVADGMLPWSWVEQRLEAAKNYWVATVGPDGAPHSRPIDGVWVDGALCFGGSPETRWVRNLHEDTRMSVHLPHDDEVVVLEGRAEFVDDPEHPLAESSARATRTKYPQYFDASDDPPFRPFWAMRPETVYAWTLSDFPRDMTRWRFG
jgi:general stress protein 26